MSLYSWNLIHSLYITLNYPCLGSFFSVSHISQCIQYRIFSGPNGADNPSCIIIRQSRVSLAALYKQSFGTLISNTSWVQKSITTPPQPPSTSLMHFLVLVLCCSKFYPAFFQKKIGESKTYFVSVAAIGKCSILQFINCFKQSHFQVKRDAF